MIFYPSLTVAKQFLDGITKWDRSFAAISDSAHLPAHITFSIGDSLTWRKISGQTTDEYFLQSIDYLRVLYCKEGTATISVLRDGTVQRPYSNLDDRMYVNAEANSSLKEISLHPGNLVIFDAFEATKVCTSKDFTGVQLRVTALDTSFPNK